MTIFLLLLVIGLAVAGLIGVIRLVASDGFRRVPVCRTSVLER